MNELISKIEYSVLREDEREAYLQQHFFAGDERKLVRARLAFVTPEKVSFLHSTAAARRSCSSNKKFDRIKSDLIEKLGSNPDHQCGAFYMTPGIDIDNCSSENLTAWFRRRSGEISLVVREVRRVLGGESL